MVGARTSCPYRLTINFLNGKAKQLAIDLARETFKSVFRFTRDVRLKHFLCKNISSKFRKGKINFDHLAGWINPPFESLSRMMGNYQARFLGNKGGVISLSYPTTTKSTE